MQAVGNGDITEERINDAVRRILTVKFELGVFNHPYFESGLLKQVGSAEHRSIARQAVRESLVLLKNDSVAFPLSQDTRLIYVAGQGSDDVRMQCGGWTTSDLKGNGDLQTGTTLLEGIRSVVSRDATVEYNTAGEFDGVADVGIVVGGGGPFFPGGGGGRGLRGTFTKTQTISKPRAPHPKIVG